MKVSQDTCVLGLTDRTGLHLDLLNRRRNYAAKSAQEKDLKIPPPGHLPSLDFLQFVGQRTQRTVHPGHTSKLSLFHDGIGLLDHQASFVLVRLGDHCLIDL